MPDNYLTDWPGDAAKARQGFSNSYLATFDAMPVGVREDIKTQINVYNVRGYLINTVYHGNDVDALFEMLINALVYSGAGLCLSNAPYHLNTQSNSFASHELWLRNNCIYFRKTGADPVYIPENAEAAGFKRIINYVGAPPRYAGPPAYRKLRRMIYVPSYAVK